MKNTVSNSEVSKRLADGPMNVCMIVWNISGYFYIKMKNESKKYNEICLWSHILFNSLLNWLWKRLLAGLDIRRATCGPQALVCPLLVSTWKASKMLGSSQESSNVSSGVTVRSLSCPPDHLAAALQYFNVPVSHLASIPFTSTLHTYSPPSLRWRRWLRRKKDTALSLFLCAKLAN